ncbi:anhydro-N-acetylmuramic acid kinase [Denitratimonas sp. CY0512]|uniref:anhydro-N-acetylmuramic acid kinase n=1 Tax=Denitratimonas sp. CY0512 TaxID=3131940 RepID=UPI0030A86D75
MRRADASSSGLHLGLISGTSVDGIDAALVHFEDTQAAPTLVAAHTFAYTPELRKEILALSQAAVSVDLDRVARLDHRIGAAFAEAASTLLHDHAIAPEQVRAIGSHGQTLRHAPHGDFPFSWQIGDANLIAERTGITTIADFRRRDVAAGGQGAPLMPAFHQAMLAPCGEDTAVLNLGGIANLTLLPRAGEVSGFDTGPANGLMDAWMLEHCAQGFDADGRFASSGQPDEALLAALLAEPWFMLPPPKSTGRDLFHLAWLRRHIGARELAAADVQATLLELSARSIVQALRCTQAGTRRLFVCGGGVHNGALMRRLAQLLPDASVQSTAVLGIDPDFVEAMGFAWLARQTLEGLAGNLPAVTGACGPRVLGAIHPA